MDDLISRQAAIDAIEEYADRLQMVDWKENPAIPYKAHTLNWCINTIRDLPSAQPDYQEVLGWLLAYHTMSFDLHCRYLPHDVISWLINDFTKKFIAERRQNERLG